jgi:hypothetical protein
MSLNMFAEKDGIIYLEKLPSKTALVLLPQGAGENMEG